MISHIHAVLLSYYHILADTGGGGIQDLGWVWPRQYVFRDNGILIGVWRWLEGALCRPLDPSVWPDGTFSAVLIDYGWQDTMQVLIETPIGDNNGKTSIIFIWAINIADDTSLIQHNLHIAWVLTSCITPTWPEDHHMSSDYWPELCTLKSEHNNPKQAQQDSYPM